MAVHKENWFGTWPTAYDTAVVTCDQLPMTLVVKKSSRRLEAVSYESRRFFPVIYLVNNVTGDKYIDHVLPAAKQKIAVREQISAPLYDSVEMQRVKIPHSTDDQAPGVWGVVTWERHRSGDRLSVSQCSGAYQRIRTRRRG